MSALSSYRQSRTSPFERRLASVVLAALFLSAGGNLGAQGGKPPSKPPAQPPTSPTAPPADSAQPRSDSTQAPESALASITGSVYDSVHMAPLQSAAVHVVGTTRMSFTNESGRYRIDSVPPGMHRVGVEHALLDSIGVTMVTDSFELHENDSKILDLAVPSSETLVAVSCPPARRALGPTAIIGRLLDADTDAPVQGSRVSFAWSEISITSGLRRVPRVMDATTGADGVFRVCGLPKDVEGTLQAEMKGITTAEVPIRIEATPLRIQGLRIGNAKTVAQVDSSVSKPGTSDKATGQRFSALNLQRGDAVLQGRVVFANGQPVVGARVDVRNAVSATLTKENGEFTLSELPPGTQTVIARQIGFAPVEVPVDLSTRATRTVTITMSKPAAQPLPTVEVKAEQDKGLDNLGFISRQRIGNGYFVTGDDVMKRAPNVLTDVFRTIPLLRVTPGGAYGNEYIVEETRRQGLTSCVRYVVDNAPWEALYPGDLDRLMPPWEVGAIEVYSSASVPIQFTGAGQSACTVIVIWSKSSVDAASRRKK